MKIAILGTRGIPNHYGGFEQYAELLSVYLVEQGWDVTVYNSKNHPYKEKYYKGVKIIPIYDPEDKIGTIGQFVYDLGCILDTRKQKFDVVYQLGYTSSSIFNFLFSKSITLVTNMDGMEWKRTKYNKYVQHFLMYAEKIAAKRSHFLVADSLGIKKYLDDKYKTESYFSAYTATVPTSYSISNLASYDLVEKEYNLLVARLEPENNIEAIIEGHIDPNSLKPLIIIGNQHTQYGKFLVEKYKDKRNIRFLGAVYNKEILDSIRHFSNFYFHGHSVGGTNPSLLEAMACGCNIIANNNIFNKSVLGTDALYFDDAITIQSILLKENQFQDFYILSVVSNVNKIKEIYSEDYIFYNLKEKLIDWQKEYTKLMF